MRKPFLTLAGQSAPSPGITLRAGTLRIATHDVLVQHIRIRVGDDPPRGGSPWPTTLQVVVPQCEKEIGVFRFQ